MAFIRPTLTTIIARVRGDIESKMAGADSRLRRSVIGVWAIVIGGMADALYGLLDFVWKQILPDQAEGAYLDTRHNFWGVLRKGVTPARGSVSVTGTTGAIVPLGTVLVRSDAVEYLTLAAVTLVAGAAVLLVEARVGGVSGNADAAQRLTFSSPIAGVNAQGLVAVGGLIGGSEEESDDALRARIITRIQQPPRGGNRDDFVNWALEVPGVTRAWLTPHEMGPGQLTLRFVMDGRVDIIPQPADIAAVLAYVDAKRPVGRPMFVLAPIAVPLNMTIRAVPPTLDVRNAITEEIADLLRREAAPGGTLLISHIREAVSLAAGEMDHEIIVPFGNVNFTVGSIPIPGVITWA